MRRNKKQKCVVQGGTFNYNSVLNILKISKQFKIGKR